MVRTDWLARAMAAFAMAAQVRFVGAEDSLQWWAALIGGSTWLAISIACLIVWRIQQ